MARRKINKFLILALLFIPNIVFAAPPTRQFNYVANNTIDPVQNNANENALYTYLQTGVDTFAPSSITGVSISSSAGISYSQLSLAGSIQQSDITSGRFLLSSGDVFMRVTGSCPSGTTDISATYSNRFLKINSTSGTTGSLVFTATTDTHVLTQAELPNSSLNVKVDGSTAIVESAGGDGPSIASSAHGGASHTLSVALGGSGTGHTHTISTASTLEPASVTIRLCQVQ